MSSQTNRIATLLASINDTAIVSGIYTNRISKVNAASERLYRLLISVLPEQQVHPATSHEKREYPDCMYELGTTDTVIVNTSEVAHIVKFFIILRDKNIDALSHLADQIAVKIEAQNGMNTIDVASGGYESDEHLYHLAIELEMSYPLGVQDDQYQSIAVLYPSAKAEKTPYTGGCTRQKIHNLYSIIVTAASEEKLDLLIRQVQNCLIGKAISDSGILLSYQDGNMIELGGGLFSRVERYLDTHRIPEN